MYQVYDLPLKVFSLIFTILTNESTNFLLWSMLLVVYATGGLDCNIWHSFCLFESLFLGFLKEDLFYFFQIIFQDSFIFHISLLYCFILANITSMACLKQLSSNIVSEPSEFVCFIYQKLPFIYKMVWE